MASKSEVQNQKQGKSCFKKTVPYVNLCLQVLTVLGLIIVIGIYFYSSSQKQDVTCAVNPCQNGGTCMSDDSKVTCGCAAGFIGAYCQYVNPCHGHICQNGGSCFVSDGEPVCVCINGYSGGFCEIDRDPCFPNPCNGGMCTQVGKSYRCNCDPGYLGNMCDTVDPCMPTPCKHEGLCTATTDDTFHCTCQPDWMGKLCEQGVPTGEPVPLLQLNIATLVCVGVTMLILVGQTIFMCYSVRKHRTKKGHY